MQFNGLCMAIFPSSAIKKDKSTHSLGTICLKSQTTSNNAIKVFTVGRMEISHIVLSLILNKKIDFKGLDIRFCQNV